MSDDTRQPMSESERWARIEQLFHSAVELPREERAGFLEGACDGDAALLREVQLMLNADSDSSGFLADPPTGAKQLRQASNLSNPTDVQANEGRRVGAYRLIRLLGAGGMGAVWLAERADAHFEMKVAVKLMKPGLDTENLLERFKNERQVLANIEHPNIARLVDGGATDDGMPFLAMEYVEGVPIDQYCDERRLVVAKRIKLFQSVCNAVQHAHRNLVVHRDLKPQNIMVTAAGEVKLLDFGIAKVLQPNESVDRLNVTATGRQLMTPRYASPEQVSGAPITTASDIYSLGVVLYELLTGHRPYHFGTASAGQVERIICEAAPTKPSTAVSKELGIPTEEVVSKTGLTLQTISRARGLDPAKLKRLLAGDLDTIVLMALRKEPQRRYASVAQFSEDLQRFLDGLPVIAQADTLRYRTAKFIRRNSIAVAAGTVVVAAILTALVATTSLYRKAQSAYAEAAAISSFLQETLSSVDPEIARGRDVTILRELLEQAGDRIETDLSAQPRAAASLHRTIGKTYRRLGLFDQAEKHLVRGEELTRPSSGGPARERINMLRELAALRNDQGELAEARVLFREALALSEKHFDENDETTSLLVQELGELLTETGDYEEAGALLERALQMNRRLHGERSHNVSGTLSAIGLLLRDQGRYQLACERLAEAVAIARADLPPDHPKLATMLHNYGWALVPAEDFDAAENAYREALEIRKRILPDDHPKLGLTMGNLALIERIRGNYAKSARSYRDVIDFLSRTLGPRHMHVASTMNNLALVLGLMGDDQAAASHYRDAADIYREALDPEHPYVAVSLTNLGRVHQKQEKYDEALPIFLQVLELRHKRLPADHPLTAATVSDIATVLAKTDRANEARPYFKEELARRRELMGDRHPCVAALLGDYAEFLVQHQLGSSGAEPMLREALAILSSADPVDHKAQAETERKLASCLIALEKFEEAESILVSLWHNQERRPNAASESNNSIQQFVSLYEAWSKHAEAAEWRAKLVNVED